MPATFTEETPKAFVELTPNGKRMMVYFHYTGTIKAAVQRIPGSHFSGYEVEQPHWTLPLTLDSGRSLREIFGAGLQLGDGVRSWGHQERRVERSLQSLAVAKDARLKRLPEVAPLIARMISGHPMPEFNLPKTHPLSNKRPSRPYQRADIAMMSRANAINANAPGTGKTLECLGAVIEGGFEKGPQLICAPVRSLDNVWRTEIKRLLPKARVFTSEDPAERRIEVARGLELARAGKPCWIMVNPDMLRLKQWKGKIDPGTGIMEDPNPDDIAFKDVKGRVYVYPNELIRQIIAIQWQTFTIDEFHLAGLNSKWSLFTIGTDRIQARRHWRMSGTPMGGKPINLFPVLRSIEPDQFSNEQTWVDKWLNQDVGYMGHRKVMGIREGLEADFYNSHSRHLVRRLKRDALPGIPPKILIEVKCGMTKNQKKQYAKFELDAEVEIQSHIGGGEPSQVVGTCILAQFTRLKQFANAYCVANEKGMVMPTTDSGKLPHLEERLDEFGIRRQLPEPDARAIVASESKRMANMVYEWLTNKIGVKCGLLTGDTKDSQEIIDWFQNGKDGLPYVIVMTTQTGGVSLNLERAGSVHILDEHWNPDRQEQLEDRGDRGTRDTPLSCLYYRTGGTIQEYIAQVAAGKKLTNANVLDTYRLMKSRTGFGG